MSHGPVMVAVASPLTMDLVWAVKSPAVTFGSNRPSLFMVSQIVRPFTQASLSIASLPLLSVREPPYEK